jgi:hypothetical protein
VTPNACTNAGQIKEPSHSYTRYKLAPGWAYHLVNGEWTEEKVTPGAVTSAVDTDRIAMIRGRACCIFTVLGMDQFAQPIDGKVSPAVEKAEKRAAKLAKQEDKPVTPPATPVSSPEGPSKAALKLAKMRARMAAK